MSFRDVFTAINRMAADGVIVRYAVGGAVGATFYLDPIATLDVDVFVGFKGGEGGLISPKPIFDYLTAHGAVVRGEYLVIAGWPVQFLPATSALVEEAIAEARRFEVEGQPVPVFTAEHLAAIALQTGRGKDKARLVQFVEAGVLDAGRLEGILSRHGLSDAWDRFEHRFIDDHDI